MKKRLLSLILVVMFLLSLVPAYAAGEGYGDMDGHWAKEAVEAVSQMGLVQGYDGKFNPDAQISRGEMAVILDRMMNYLTAAENTFTDLDENYYTEAVLKANAAGVIQGANGLVRPKDSITRQEAMVMLSRAMGLDGEGDLSAFADGEAVADWAKAAVSAMVGKGYIQGNAGLLRPTATITRAETVTILQRMVGALVDEGGTLTGKVTGTVVVRGADTKLEDLEIEGDLIIAEGVGEGNVELKNVTISGNTIVRGGGEHSILMANVRVGGGIVVSKREGRVRIVTSGNTTVSVTVLESGAILVGDGFETVEISAELAEGQTIELEGKFERLVNNSENASIKASGEIKTVEANAETDIEGKNLKINKTEGEAAVKQNGKDVAASGSTGSSGGGGGSSGGSSSRVDSSISAATMNDARKVEGAVADVDYVANANTFTVSAIKTSESLEVAGEEGKTETVSVPVSQVTVSGTLKEISYYRADWGDTAEDAVTGYWYGVKVQSPYAEADHVLYGGGDTLAKNYAFTPGDGGWAEPYALESGSLTIALQTPDAYPAIWSQGGARYFAIAWMKKVADDPAGEMESWNAGNYEVLGYSYITINPDGLKKAANVEAVTLSKSGDDKVKLSYQRNTIGSAAEVKFFDKNDTESDIFTLSGDATDGGKLGKVELEYSVTVPEEAADYYASVGGVKSAKVTLGGSGDSGDSGNGGNDSENSGTVKLNKSTLTLVENGTEKLTAEVTPAEAEVTWTSSDTSVATVDTEGNVTAVAKGTATIKATITVNGQNYSASCTVTVKKLGWDTEESEKYAVDARFAEGYPVCSFDDSNKLKLKVKIPSASAENPVEVFVVEDDTNTSWDADVMAVLHGHVGEGDDYVWGDSALYYRIEDDEEHVFEEDVYISGEDDVNVYFVLKDSTGTSEKPTKIGFGAAMIAELDTSAPYIYDGHINQARDKIYLPLTDKGLDLESVPAASAFALEGVSDATVTGVSFGTGTASEHYKTRYRYICLTVTGINADTDISELKVKYTKPEENPIQDTATTPNQTKDFTTDVITPATLSIESENVHFSSDGKYLFVKVTNAPYYAMGGGFVNTATVTVNGSSLTYKYKSGSYVADGTWSKKYYYCEDADLKAGDEAQVTLTLKEGSVDFAMDAIPSTVTGTGTIPAATTDLKMVSAEYGKFGWDGNDEAVLKITFNTEFGGDAERCSFQLSDGTNTYVMRDDEYYNYSSSAAERGKVLYLGAEDGGLWVTPEAGWTLTYKPLHEDDTCLMKEKSGKPMAEQTIAITIVDDSAD